MRPRPPDPARGDARIARHEKRVARLDRIAPRLRGGTVYTDDRAPVEWLVDKSIVEYAAGGG